MGLINMKNLIVLSFFTAFTFAAAMPVNSLSVDFYKEKCPAVEEIIKDVVKTVSLKTEDNPFPGLLRLFFHDCFVEGCDASVLITDPKKKQAEKDNPINSSLDDEAFEIVERSKKAVEEKCPGIVSCADILAILARDAVVMTKGPHWDVEKGRRDGHISMASHASAQLPHPTSNLTNLIELFQSKGLSVSDLVTLSGAHTIGVTHCGSFANRLARTDSRMDPDLRRKLKKKCHFPTINTTVTVGMDVRTSSRFDAAYYQEIQHERGILASDHAIFKLPLVSSYANNQSLFFIDFGIAMQKLGRLGLESNHGEIRKVCSRFN